MVVLKRGSGRTLHMWTSYVAAADWASLAQTTQKTISFTTVAFFLLWLLSNVLISVLVLSLIPPRDCGRQSTACVYCCTHQSRPYYVKGKSWESLLIAYPSCTAAFWTEPHSGKYTAGTDSTLTTTMPSVTVAWKWLEPFGILFCTMAAP